MNISLLLNLVINYFHFYQKESVLTVYNCRSIFENVNLLKGLSAKGFSASIIQLNEATDVKHAIETMYSSSVGVSTQGIVLHYDCPKTRDIISYCSVRQCFSSRFKWLIYEEKSTTNESNAIKQLKTTNLFVDAEITYISLATSFQQDKENDTYVMYDIYNNAYTHGGKLHVEIKQYFIYNNDKNVGNLLLANQWEKPKSQNRTEMNDITFRVGAILPTFNSYPNRSAFLNHLFSDNDTTVDTIARYAANIIIIVVQMLNCNISYIPYDKWSINETYGGAFQGMYEGEIDLPFAFYLMSTERFYRMTILTQVTNFRSLFFFRTTSNINLFGDELLRPFSSSVWICIILTTILTGILVNIIFTWEKRFSPKRTTLFQRNVSAMIITIGALCLQGSAMTPKLLSGRCLFIFLFLTSIMIYNYYTSVLLSSLVDSSDHNKIKTLTDLANSNLKIGFEDVAYTRSYINSTIEPDMRYFFKKKSIKYDDTSGLFLSGRDGLALVRKSAYAFHCEGGTAYPIIRDTFLPEEICDVHEVPFRKNRALALVLRKKSPFQNIVSKNFYWMRETGIFFKHQRHWMIQKPACLSNAIVTSVGLNYTAPLFIFLALAYTLSIIILICEHICYNYTKNKKIIFTR